MRRQRRLWINPATAELIDLLEVNGESLNFIQSPLGRTGIRSLWNVPLVVSETVPTGYAMVGDFRRAILFDREQLVIRVGTAGDDFIRNIVRILGEVRAGFVVSRPAAFVEVDLAA